MYLHHAFHREIALDRQETLLREAGIEQAAAVAEARLESGRQLASLLSAADLVGAWLARRRRLAHRRPALPGAL